MNWRGSWLLVGLCLLGCAGTRATIGVRTSNLPLAQDPDRYIVAGVDNEESLSAGRAGSSPKGYDGLTRYGPTSRAVQLLRSVEHDYGLREIAAWPIAPLHMHCAVLEMLAPANRAAMIAALSLDKRVRIAQPLQSFSTQTAVYDDPYVGLQRGFQRLDVPEAHTWARGQGVRVAIIDTGADVQHPDLRGAIVQTANFVDADTEQFRRDRHGTELAGIIAAVANNRQGIVGIAPGARLWVLKACWQLQLDADAAQCNSFTLAQALVAALDARVQIVNLSLAGPADPLLRELIREGVRRGIVFVGAAPSGRDALLSVDGVIGVANGGAQGEAGSPLHAPGKEILTLLPGGRYDFASGASLSTAHVTGAVALLLERQPGLTAGAAYRLLRDTTVRTGDEDSINACGALTSLIGHGSCGREVPSDDRVAMH
ncbi:MAG: S8 family serine peptidase [Pseudomonadota bacterium]|nr:S8 family serine peptidase [Pseudomonadota bacterium]